VNLRQAARALRAYSFSCRGSRPPDGGKVKAIDKEHLFGGENLVNSQEHGERKMSNLGELNKT